MISLSINGDVHNTFCSLDPSTRSFSIFEFRPSAICSYSKSWACTTHSHRSRHHYIPVLWKVPRRNVMTLAGFRQEHPPLAPQVYHLQHFQRLSIPPIHLQFKLQIPQSCRRRWTCIRLVWPMLAKYQVQEVPQPLYPSPPMVAW